MAKFQSSARSMGFNAVNMPDNARRIQEAGRKRADDLRRVYEQSIAQQQQYLEDRRASDATVNQQMEKNNSLRREFEDSYKRAYRENQIKQIDKLKAEQEMELSAYERLGEFSKGALEVGKKLYESNMKERQAYGMALIMETGVTAEEMAALRKGEIDLEIEGAKNNAMVESLKAKGIGPAEIKRLQDLNGWALYGAQQAQARNAKFAWFAQTNNPENRKVRYDVGNNKMMSLEEAEQMGDSASRSNILAQMKGEFFKSYSNYSPAFAEKYIYPGMREVDQQNRIKYTQDLSAKNKEDEKNTRYMQLGEVLNSASQNPYALQNYLKIQSGGQGGALLALKRKEMWTDLKALAEAGMLTSDQYSQLLQQKVTINGKETTFFDQFVATKDLKKKFGPDGQSHSDVENAIRAYQVGESEVRQRELRAKAVEWEMAFNSQHMSRMGEAYNAREIEGIYKSWFELTGKLQLPDTVSNVLNAVPLSVEVAQQYQTALADAKEGRIKTLAQLNTKYPDLNDTQKQVIIDYAGIDPKQGSIGNDKFYKPFYNTIRAAIKTNVQGDNVTGDANAITLQMSEVAFDYFDQQYRIQVFLPENADKSKEQLAREITDNILKDIKAEQNLFEKVGKTFKYVLSPEQAGTGTTYARELRNAETALNNNTPIGTGKALGPQTGLLAQDLMIIGETGQPTAWIIGLAKQQGMDWKTFYNLQAKDYGFAPLPLDRHEQVSELIHPNTREFLGRFQSSATLQEATSQQQRVQGKVGLEVYRPILNLIASQESSNDIKGKGYDAMNLGGTDGGHTPIGTTTGEKYFGKPLTSMTVGEILDLYDAGKLHVAGRYQFKGSTIRDVFNRGFLSANITRDSLFNEETQDILAVDYFRMTVQDYSGSMDNVIYGLGQRWIGLQKLPYERKKQLVEQIQNDPRYQTPGFQGYEVDPAFEDRRQQIYGGAQ